MSAQQLLLSAGQQLMSLSNQFPVLQLNQTDVRRGAVKVTARAPSGVTRSMDIQLDPSGQYTTNFTPNEVGDWVISIMYGDKNIQGSPFNVRVYDPTKVRVFDLQDGGNSGKPISFSVDTAGAGSGDVTVEVMYMSRMISTRQSQKDHVYHISFMPEGSGVYTIHVYFARMEVTGSPFSVEVANPSLVNAQGEGLTQAKVGRKTSFLINTFQDANVSDLAVRVTPPKGAQIPATLTKVGNGVFRSEYLPKQVGDHMVDISFHGSSIPGSPFTCQVYDASQIIVTGIPETTVVDKVVDFNINAVDSGNGPMEILINDGKVPCKIVNLGNRQYRASFTPTEPVPHNIQIKFNEHEIIGSPWTVEVRSAEKVHTTAADLHLLLINTVASFQVHTQADGNVQANIVSPSRQVVPTSVSRQSPGVYDVEFVPKEIGTYKISVSYEGLKVAGSPYTCHVYDPSCITVSPIDPVAAGHLVEFTVDAGHAGVGELTIVVNHGAIPSTARMIGSNVYAVSFMAQDAGHYTVELYFNDQPIKDSPILVPVIDPSGVTLHGGRSALVPVHELAVVRANTQAAGAADIVAKVTSPSCKDVVARVNGTASTGYDIEFTPTEAGPYRVDVEYGGVTVPSGPMTVMAYDVSRIRVMGIKDGIVDNESSFIVDLNSCGEGELDVCILSSNGHPVLNEVTPIEPGRLQVKYTPNEGGIYFAEVTFNTHHAPGSPFKFNVLDPKKVTTRGDGLCLVQCNELASFIILAPDAEPTDIDVVITGPNGRQVIPKIQMNRPGNFLVEYLPTVAGIYQVDIHYFGEDIPGSPFAVRSWDASRVLIANLKQSQVGIESFFNIELADAGDGTVEISIAGPNGQLIPNQVVTAAPGLLEVHYVPVNTGIHRVSVTYNGCSVATGLPSQFNVVDIDKVTVRGDGLGLVQCGKVATFIINAPDAHRKDIDVCIRGANGKELIPNITEFATGNFRVEYTPLSVGVYEVHVSYFGKEISCSPYQVKAWDASRVLLADVSMGQVGIESSFKVVVSEAGEGVLEISLTDPLGHLLANQVLPVEPGVLEVVYTPKVTGIHKGHVTFNREKVSASPFTFLVIDPNNVSCWGDGLTCAAVNKIATFCITAPQAQTQDVSVKVIGPTGNEVFSRLTQTGAGTFKVDYSPTVAGVYLVNVFYYGRIIPSCPIQVNVWDTSKIRLSPISTSVIGIQSQFTVDAREAGDGNLEVAISGPQAERVNCDVRSDGLGAYIVSFIPLSSGLHSADVRFNREPVSGSPFAFTVADPNNVTVAGDGLQLVRCGKSASFVVSAPAAKLADINVKITGPNQKNVQHRIQSSGPGTFVVDYVPLLPGDYQIAVKYFDEAVRSSPFIAHAWDPAAVTVSDIRPAVVGRPAVFNVNALNAGSGSLEMFVTCRGENIPNVARPIGKTGQIEVSFVPRYVEAHFINVRFNDESVPGSPFTMPVLDGSLATASGPGLGHVITEQATTFNVATRNVGGDADLAVLITSPSRQQIVPVISGSPNAGYVVTYTPVEAGIHTIDVGYADMAIKGSPFSASAYDPTAVRVIGQIPSVSLLGKPVPFSVDASKAGEGHVIAHVRGRSSQLAVTKSGSAQTGYLFNFLPTETGPHQIIITFNDVEIPGSPFTCNIIDSKNFQVHWDSVRLKPVNEPVVVELLTDGSANESEIECTVTDPYDNAVVVKHSSKQKVHYFQFVASDVGPHLVNLTYSGESVPGSPYTVNIYDAKRVRVIDATPCGNIGEEVGFTVDTCDAGIGDVDVEVTEGPVPVPARRQQLSQTLTRFTFVARSPKDHLVHIKFNNENIPISPLILRVVNPASKMSLSNGNASKSVPVSQTVWAVVCQPGHPVMLDDISAKAFAPNNELLPARVLQQSDGSIRIEYQSMYTGQHILEVTYAGQLIPGNPILTEIFDPSKILLEGTKSARVGEVVAVEVNRINAGHADLSITITDPQGIALPFDVDKTEVGERITYVPQKPGTHRVQLTYGGLNVPGCPVRQEIVDVVLARAFGNGLLKGIVDRESEFVIDVNNQRGDLCAQVQGPNSLAICTIEPETGGQLRVKYTPTEVGIFTILLDWNGTEVIGSPFHPKVIDPSKVQIVGARCKWVSEDCMLMKVNELQTVVFDTRNAGPGDLRATVEGPGGDINTDFLTLNPNEYAVKFLPKKEGDYYIRVYWSDLPISFFPITAKAVTEISPPPPPPGLDILMIEHISEPPPPPIRPEMVCVYGPGLAGAYVNDHTEFIIDGREAGPGVPEIKLVGLKSDINVTCTPVDDNAYSCSYVPEIAGAYLLSITWSGQHVPGSPFKVSVLSSCDASKVVCSGEGLVSGYLDRESSVLIDTRRAGFGEVVAQCAGPTKLAYCDIIDRHDGTFELLIRPQETGLHSLQIQYGGEQVPKSPFAIKVTAAPDPSKVKVSGEGIQNGILATYQSTFLVDTRGAGPGQLTVKVRGPKGAFRVEMTRQPGSDRVITCRYHPTEVGDYQVYVLWSGQHVPGSPFIVRIVDTMEQMTYLHGVELPADTGTLHLPAGTDVSGTGSLRAVGLVFTDDY